MARAECEDGAIYHMGRKGPVWHGGVRRRCYDIHIIASLQIIENEWLCVIQMYMCVCDPRGMLDVLSYMTMKPSEYKFS